ncbi:MAG: acetate kinase [Chloracidobacterium sp.]|nr:acetate kinase [Chloracidobacterium sp.]MDW8216674.1 acetate kinase [Acidobacteriota bacterium]
MNILVLNCGSSSVKFQIIATDLHAIEHNADRRLAAGVVERIGGEAVLTFRVDSKVSRQTAPVRDHRQAIEQILRWACSSDSGIAEVQSISDIHAVGHRVAHGGECFTSSTLITDDVIRGIEACIDLAPLHNPANLKGIRASTEVFGPGFPQVAVFDTAFHQTLPETAYLYALPYQLYRRHRLRRYGFHGTSFRYVAFRYRQITGKSREDTNIVALHLGNGCSACAIKAGASVDTSMGFTPLEGLMMGTRSGDLDPSIVDFLEMKEGFTAREIEALLNKQSGLLGISGLTNDMRDLLDEIREHDDRRAKLAVSMFCYRAKKYIGAYLAAMNGADAVVFTGGIGENSAEVRARICDGLDWFGLVLDPARNHECVNRREGLISQDGARLAVYVIPTDEELLIARDTARCVAGAPNPY